MKKQFFNRSKRDLLFLITICAGTMLTVGAAWGITVIPIPALVPLNQIAVPQPSNISTFVKSNDAAVRLGKALFWDMQVGSDGVTACASCHFKAGADNRVKNTVNPGPGNVWEAVTGPNQTLPPTAFPFHQRANPDLQSAITRDFHDIVGSQGVHMANFVGITPGSAVDNVTPVSDTLFSFGGQNVRQVTGRNTPSVINAIFNFNNFWDGRASFAFNGENPFGPADPNAGVWYHNGAGATLAKKKVSIDFASLASLATGPALNDVEMSAKGRTFPELGRKMLSLVPLGKQLVHPGDSVLGFYQRAVRNPDGTITGANGLEISYSQMIRTAFVNNLWNSPQTVIQNTVGGPKTFTQEEANFPLFWGLAIQAYLATLVSDQTPFDRFLGGDNLALTDQQKLGFNIFQGVGNCNVCHGGTELTNVSQTSIAFVDNGNNAIVDLMFTADGTQVIYDNGYFNTAVTPIADDIARGGNTPFFNPLSIPVNLPIPLNMSRLAELKALGQLPFAAPILPFFIPPNTIRVNAKGSFKSPGLRNVELTAPYFHNGSAQTLDEVVEFYVRGGNVPILNITELDPVILSGIPLLQGDPVRKAALVAFLKSLTDPRVVAESAPFDHPELLIPNGDPVAMIRLPARDADGQAAPSKTITLNPVTTPTSQTSQTIGGTVEAGATVEITVNGTAPAAATFTTITTWSFIVTGLVQGNNSITVTATDANNVATTLNATILFDVQPVGTIVINGGAAASNSLSVTLALSASGVNPITSMQFSKDGVIYYAWEPIATSRVVTLLPGEGTKTMYVRFKDSLGNVSQAFSDSISFDSTPPFGSLTIHKGATLTNSLISVLTLTANDLNGVTSMQFSKDGVNYFAWEPFATTRVVTLLPGEGTKTLYVRFKDSAGNISPAFSDTIIFETIPPTGTIAVASPNPTTLTTGTLTLTATDANVVTQMQFSKDGINFFPFEPFAASRTVMLAPGINTLTVRFKDGAGNVSLPVSTSITRN